MDSCYGNYFNDVPWKKLFSLKKKKKKKKQRLYLLIKTVESVALIINPLERQHEILPLFSSSLQKKKGKNIYLKKLNELYWTF